MPIDPEQFERLRSEVDENLRKLEDENEKFQELMADRRPEDGPWNWRHTENVADRLHNFYRGVEQILKRIAKEIDGQTPEGQQWHKDLLRQVSSSSEGRPSVFDWTPATCGRGGSR